MSSENEAGTYLAVNHRPEIDAILERIEKRVPRRHRNEVGRLCGDLTGIVFRAGFQYAKWKINQLEENEND